MIKENGEEADCIGVAQPGAGVGLEQQRTIPTSSPNIIRLTAP